MTEDSRKDGTDGPEDDNSVNTDDTDNTGVAEVVNANEGVSPTSRFDHSVLEESSHEDGTFREFDDIDIVATARKKKTRKVKIIVFITLLTIIALLIGGYLGLRAAVEDAYDEQAGMDDPNGPEAPVEELPDSERPVEIEEHTNVFSSLYSGDPDPYEDSEEVELGNDRFVFSGSQVMLEADDGELVEGDSVDCVLTNATDICYAGYVEFEDNEDIEVYAVKNIVDNRLFERMSEDTIETITVTGAEAAVVGHIVSASGEDEDDAGTTTPILAAAAENGSGFMLMFSPNSEGTAEDLAELYAPEFTVHNG